MRERNRQREQLRGFIRSEAEHQSLVAGALVFAVAHALRNGARLLPDGIRDGHRVGAECLGRIGVADGPDRLTHNPLDCGGRQRRGRGDLASHHNQAILAQGFDRHARLGVPRQIGVEQRIRNPVRDFIGMPFGNGLGGEEEITVGAHQAALPSCIGRTGSPSRACSARCASATSRSSRATARQLVPRDSRTRDLV